MADATALSTEQGAMKPAGADALVGASTRATTASIAGSVPGFFVPIAIATVFGASAGTDAFLLALSVASFTANALGSTTQQAAIPFLIQARGEQRDIGAFLGQMTTVLLALAVVPMVAVNIGVPIYFGRWGHWSPSAAHLLAVFLWAFVPYVICAILAGVYSGALNARHLYVRVALSPAIRSLIVLAALGTAPFIGMYSLVVGYVSGEFVRASYLVSRLAGQVPIRLFAQPRREMMGGFLRSALAQMLGSGALALVPVVDRVMAAGLAPGTVSILDYADRLWQVPLGFAMSGLMVTTLAHWSERLYGGGTIGALSTSTRRLSLAMLAILMPLAVIFAVLRHPLIDLVFGHTRLTIAERHLLADTLAVLVGGMPVYVAGLTYTRAFLVLKRSDWLLAIGVLQLGTKTILNLILIPIWGLVGIAFATALTYTLSSALLVVIFHARLIHTPIAASGPTRA